MIGQAVASVIYDERGGKSEHHRARCPEKSGVLAAISTRNGKCHRKYTSLYPVNGVEGNGEMVV